MSEVPRTKKVKKRFQNIIPTEPVKIFDIAEDGKGVGRVDDFVVFVENAVPGDIVNIEVYRKKKSFGEAKVLSFVEYSEHRAEPFCKHFGVCGGCKWQHMNYPSQLSFKQNSVKTALERIGKVEIQQIEQILGSKENQYYRNKLEFTFSNKKWLTEKEISDEPQEDMDALGFHVPGRFDKILEIDHCYLQANPSNAIRLAVGKKAKVLGLSFYDLRNHEGAMRNLIIRTSSTGEIMVIVVFAYADQDSIKSLMNFIKNEFPEVTSLLYVENQKRNDTIFDQDIVLFHGNDCIMEEMEGLKFKIGPKSFYQTNSAQAYELYKLTREFAEFTGNELVYDLYTGAGTIANFIARNVKQVIGVEYVPSAIEDAYENSKLNGIKNTKFFAGDMKDVLTAEFITQHGKPDVVITDPPRAGMHPAVVDRLLEMRSPKIVYVSCNAATQARDLSVLSEAYDVVRIKPVDMFPHTQHVENIVLLKIKN